ncbi:MAG: divergent polysaccharide deacetylase family protein [Alphaproteobacteria bacterium]|nr:divergent polysaccharide deacetylase family protein [Alphaproteobacteria bacterium]
MKKNLFKICGIILIVALYTGALLYLKLNYSESRWIPKISLNLPGFVGHNMAKYPAKMQASVDVPPVEQSDSELMTFQVLFDNFPLQYVELVQDWENETNAAQTYAKSIKYDESKPRLAILLTNVGLNEKLFAESILRLPPVVTLSFSPYTSRLSEKIKYARQRGFENMFDIVTEGPGGFDNGGALAIRNGQSAFEVENLFQRTYFDLNVPFVGFVLGGKMPLDDNIWKQIVQQKISQFGLSLLPYESIEWSDSNELYANALKDVLKQAESKATEKGQLILALPMHPVVIQVLTDWVGVQNHPDISFVPVSALIENE